MSHSGTIELFSAMPYSAYLLMLENAFINFVSIFGTNAGISTSGLAFRHSEFRSRATLHMVALSRNMLY
jgi:hypothetical protein